MKYDRNTMKSLQEAYNESKKPKDTGIKTKKQLEKMRTGLGAGVDQAELDVGYKEPKISKSKKRIGEAIEMSRKEYTSEAKIDSIYSRKKDYRGRDELTQKRNERNAKPGENRDIDRKTFYTREPGEPEDVARGRARKQFSDQQRGKKKIKGSKTKDSMGRTLGQSQYLYDKQKTISDRKSLDRIYKNKSSKGHSSLEEGMGEKNCGCGETPCKTYSKQKEVEDMRSLPTRMNLIKTKLRAMGLNMSHQLKGKELSEVIDYTLAERNRYEKETGIDTKTGKKIVKGGTAKNDLAFQAVMRDHQDERVGANQKKKKRGAKTDEGTGKFLKMQNQKKQTADQTAADAKKRGFDNVQNYVDTMARYGGKKNYDSGKGLGS